MIYAVSDIHGCYDKYKKLLEKLEELEKQMAAEFDPDKRAELAIQMQQAILDDNGYVFCSFLEMNQISRAGVVNYTAHACDYYQITADLDIVD